MNPTGELTVYPIIEIGLAVDDNITVTIRETDPARAVITLTMVTEQLEKRGYEVKVKQAESSGP